MLWGGKGGTGLIIDRSEGESPEAKESRCQGASDPRQCRAPCPQGGGGMLGKLVKSTICTAALMSEFRSVEVCRLSAQIW